MRNVIIYLLYKNYLKSFLSKLSFALLFKIYYLINTLNTLCRKIKFFFGILSKILYRFCFNLQIEKEIKNR